MDIEQNFTDEVLSTSPLPALEGNPLLVEKLLILLHYGTDFSIWGGDRTARYWKALTEQCKAGCYRNTSISGWWCFMVERLSSEPRNAKERKETIMLLEEIKKTNQESYILSTLRNESDFHILRLRVIAESRKEHKQKEG